MVKLTARHFGEVTVIDAEGRITLGDGASYLRDFIRNQVTQGRKNLVLVVAGVEYADSCGISEMVSGFTYASNRGGTIKLVALTKRVKDLLQITKLYTVFEVFDDEATAVRSFN